MLGSMCSFVNLANDSELSLRLLHQGPCLGQIYRLFLSLYAHSAHSLPSPPFCLLSPAQPASTLETRREEAPALQGEGLLPWSFLLSSCLDKIIFIPENYECFF